MLLKTTLLPKRLTETMLLVKRAVTVYHTMKRKYIKHVEIDNATIFQFVQMNRAWLVSLLYGILIIKHLFRIM